MDATATNGAYPVTGNTIQPALTTEEKLRLRLSRLPPRRMLMFVVVTGEQGEIVQYSEMAEGKAQS